MITDPV